MILGLLVKPNEFGQHPEGLMQCEHFQHFFYTLLILLEEAKYSY